MKLHKNFILLLALFVFQCTTKNESRQEIFYVIKHQKIIPQELDNNDIPPPPPPPIIYYGNYNFILLDSSTVYFHKRKDNRTCFIDMDDSKPPRMFLTPDSLTKIEIVSLAEFLRTTVSVSISSDRHFFASISSPTDTIRNRAFKIITEFFKAKKIHFYNIRNWTEEEQYVTEARIENKVYDATKVKWKVGFEENYSTFDDFLDAKKDKNK